MTTTKRDLIPFISKILKIIMLISVIGELVFFPSWKNLCGCLMCIICWWIFDCFFLKRSIILKYPFAFMLFLSMFLYRYLPLPATLFEGNPITLGLQMPYETFFLETILFIVSALAFYCSFSKRNYNNYLQLLLEKSKLFKPLSSSALWCLGGIGLIARLSTFSAGDVEYGDAGNKFMSGLVFLMYAPLCMFFPSIYKDTPGFSESNRIKKSLWFYLVFITLLGIAGNSREKMIVPIGTISLLFMLFLCKENVNLARFSFKKIAFIGISLFILLGTFSDISTAMIYNRSKRSDISKSELFKNTIDTYSNKSLMKSLKQDEDGQIINYKDGWDETYVSNFLLNRYCNIRITDETLYYALSTDDRNHAMLKDFINRTISVLPTPIINLLGIDLDKRNLDSSRGDVLYALCTNSQIFAGYRVTSHVADGLITFGLFYFPIQFMIFFCVFKLLNSLVFYKGNRYIYSILGLISIFSFLGMFRNANGCVENLQYCLRGFWQSIILFGIINIVLHKIFPTKVQ